ncbi:uncharacterized protein TNCV_1579941 [Trichonephila clavipes]|nr:uncharacterized protein TNCV_1579941 [Trichonephila clavipes]
MNPDDLYQFSERFKEKWLSIIKVAVEKAERFANMCENCETVYCLVNTNFSKLCEMDFPKEASRCNEARADLRRIHFSLTKIHKLMKSMRFMRNITSINLKLVSSHVNFENVTHSQLHEAIVIIEKFERAVSLLCETINRANMTISEYQKKVEEIIKTYPKVGSNEE